MKKVILQQAPQEPSSTANEAGGEDTDGVRGDDQQQGGVFEMHIHSCRAGFHREELEEESNISLSGNVSAAPLETEEMSEYEKISAANLKQKGKLLKNLKRDWWGFKESEGFQTGGSEKGAKKLRVVEKEAFNGRRAKELKVVRKEAARAHPRSVKDLAVKDQLRGQRSKQDLGIPGTGLDNRFLETIMQLRKVVFILGILDLTL